MAEFEVGERVLGHWRAIEAFVSAGRSEMWKVRHDVTGIMGVLKLRRDDDGIVDRPTLASLAEVSEHPNLETLLDFGITDRNASPRAGRTFVVTQFYDGLDLATLLERDGVLSVHAVRTIGRSIARALGALHAQGLVHRDVKPSNILIPHGTDPWEAARLIDFDLVGVRKPRRSSPRDPYGHVEDADDDAGTTMANAFVGTPAYMSPEQVAGSGLTHQADLWSLGAVLYEASTGERPFQRGSLYALMMAIRDERPSFARVPPELRPVLQRALEPSLSDRIPNAASFERLLSNAALHLGFEDRGEEDVLTRGEALRPSPPEPPVSPAVDPSPAPTYRTAANALHGMAPASVLASPDATHTALPIGEPARPTAPLPSPHGRAVPRMAIAIPAVLVLVAIVVVIVRARPMVLASGRPVQLVVVVVSIAAGIGVGLLTSKLLRRGGAVSPQASRVSQQPNDPTDVTQSMALAIRELAARYRSHERANLMTTSMAFVLKEYNDAVDRDASLKAADRLDLTLRAVEAIMRFEAQVADVTQPWYQRQEKAIALVGALGTVIGTWLGLAKLIR